MRDTPSGPTESSAALAQLGAGPPSQPQPSQDYMAAVHAMEEGPAELEVNGLPTPGARLQPTVAKAPKVCERSKAAVRSDSSAVQVASCPTSIQLYEQVVKQIVKTGVSVKEIISSKWPVGFFPHDLKCVCFLFACARVTFVLSSTSIPMQTESQRWVEKLHTLYSSGAVVPLPFLRATDGAPLDLLGINRGPPAAATRAGLQVR